MDKQQVLKAIEILTEARVRAQADWSVSYSYNLLAVATEQVLDLLNEVIKNT